MNRSSLDLDKIPFFKASIGDEEIASVVEVLKSGWLTSGPKVKQFEKEFAEFVGARYAVAVNSATAGLHLALEAIGIGPGDEVLVPTHTFAATAEVVIHLGAHPVLVDCDPDTMNISLADMQAKTGPKTKAVMPVHFAGHPCEMDEIIAWAEASSLRVIEDAAHAFPAAYKGETIGSLPGSLACFSFYANKTITTGEGGMVTTNDEDLADRIRQMSLHGLSRDAWNRFSAKGSWYYEIVAAGFKYNMPDVAAAIGLGQLHRADQFLEGRRRCAERYLEAFEPMDFVDVLAVRPYVHHAWHLMVIQLVLDKLSIDRSEFIVQLNQAGIGTSVHYTPLHLHPFYREHYHTQPKDFPIATACFDRIISLPLYPDMTDSQVDRVVSEVQRIGEANRR